MISIYTYWISTILLSLLYLTSATMYLLKTDWVKHQFTAFGYPGYLVVPLIFCKAFAVCLILSRFNVVLSDFAYVGMFLHLLLATAAHVGIKKSGEALPAIIGLLLIVLSFTTQNTARSIPSPSRDGVAHLNYTEGYKS